MNRIRKIILLLSEIIFTYLIFANKINSNCLIKKYLNISCPACGFTRAFKSIINLNFIEAIKYNLLSIPVFIFLIVINIILIYDIFFNKKKTDKIFMFISKYTILIIIILIINTIINNIKGI